MSPMARRKTPAMPHELLDQLNTALAEREPDAELEDQLPGQGGTSNGRKNVVRDTGRIALENPRDLQGSNGPRSQPFQAARRSRS